MTSVMRPDPRYELALASQVPHTQTEHPDTSAKVVTHLKFYYTSTFFSRYRLQVTPVDRCSRAVAQKTWNYLRMCFLWVRTLKLISTFYIIAKTVQKRFGQNGTLNFFRLNA